VRHERTDGLRRRAEKRAQEEGNPWSSPVVPIPYDEVQRVIHELRVHQLELEIRNEDLMKAQAELNSSLDRYFDLYDLAPVAYFTVDERTLIIDANLTAAKLLREERGALCNQPLTRFMLPSSQGTYYRSRREIPENGDPSSCEVMLRRSDGTFFPAMLVATPAHNADDRTVSRVVLIDTTEHMRSRTEPLSVEHRHQRVRVANAQTRDTPRHNGDAPAPMAH
jgi:PAS domain S-box-containing protein